MNNMIAEALFSAPFLSEYDTSDREVYEGSVRLREALMTRSEDDPHIINSGNLQNVWILTNYFANSEEVTGENSNPYGKPLKNPYILINSTTTVGTVDRLILVGELFSYIPHEYAFEVNAENFSTPSDKEYEEVCNEILAGRVRKIYDKGVNG